MGEGVDTLVLLWVPAGEGVSVLLFGADVVSEVGQGAGGVAGHGARSGAADAGVAGLGAVVSQECVLYLWKRDHVDAWLGDAPAVWTDDDFTGLDHEWAVERTAKGTATLLIQPDPHLGLQPEHLTEATRWVAQLRTARAA